MEWDGWSDPTNGLTMRWGPAVAYHSGFKWIWLNTGNPQNTTATLEMITLSDVVFADEALALDKVEPSS